MTPHEAQAREFLKKHHLPEYIWQVNAISELIATVERATMDKAKAVAIDVHSLKPQEFEKKYGTGDIRKAMDSILIQRAQEVGDE